MEVEFEIMVKARGAAAKSLPGTAVGACPLIPTLKPVGLQSTKRMLLLLLIIANARVTSLLTISQRYMRQQDMYFPC